jgi:hypothetical protein
MHDRLARRPAPTGGRRTLLLGVLIAATFLAALAITPALAAAETVWLCKPGLANNPCLSDETATVQLGNGTSFVEHAKPASNPPIDCFYVYPTVSSQFTTNANLEIDPEETQIAIDQASRFSQVCKVYAPIYPQLTIPAINTPGGVTPEAAAKAYIGVLLAFEDYLANFNHGRGFVLIGHSQGTAMLNQLVKEQIDPNAALRKLMVSAVLLGGNLTVPIGGTVGGSFKHVPTCQFAGQTHCVVAYSSFLKEPPNPSNFGRVGSPLLGGEPEDPTKVQVMCVNPAALVQAGNPGGPLLRYESTSPFPGLLGPFVHAPKASTPWVAMPAQYSAQCKQANGASWLQLTNAGIAGDPREQIAEVLGPLWGTHLEDVNVALGNLVALAGIQSAVYQLEGLHR